MLPMTTDKPPEDKLHQAQLYTGQGLLAAQLPYPVEMIGHDDKGMQGIARVLKTAKVGGNTFYKFKDPNNYKYGN